jgi:hypothetical protein
MQTFQPARSPRPPSSANGQASMCYSPVDETLFLVIPSEPRGGLEVWSWIGSNWVQKASGIFEDTYSGRPLVAFGRGDVHIFRATPGAFRAVQLSALDEVTSLAADGLE